MHFLLQLDFNFLQMMSMGCGMVPMMFSGVQQYMPTMGMGIGMGMGLDMGISRPMMPFPNVLAGSALPTSAAAAHLGPRFPMPAFHMPPPVPAPDPSRIQPNNQSDAMLNMLGMQNSNQPRVPNFADPYQQYLGLHQMQLPLPQVMFSMSSCLQIRAFISIILCSLKPFVFVTMINCIITSFEKIENTHKSSFTAFLSYLSRLEFIHSLTIS